MALIDKIKAIADALREKTGVTGLLTLDDMADMIAAFNSGTVEPLSNTYILVDENGNEYPAVLTEDEVDLTATANDIRMGSVAVTDEGVTTGEKEIPAYNTNEGFKAIPNGSKIVLTMKNYDYTKLQAIICLFNTSLSDSVAADKVAINDSVYPVQSVSAVSVITKNDEKTQIDFGVTNDSGAPCIVRYIMYKEVH